MSDIYELDGNRYVVRRSYLDQLKEARGKTDLVKVITGVRRCGKSTLMEQFIECLKEDGVPEDSIIHVMLESIEHRSIRTKDDLIDHVAMKRGNGMTYVLIDEIQRLEGWEEALNILASERMIDVYVTGSNAFILSSELRTFLTGREYEVKMLPLSFEEFISLNPVDSDHTRDDRFTQYLKWGGMPAIDLRKGFRFNYQLLEGYYSDILVKDVMGRLPDKTDNSKLMSVGMFLCHNIGNLTNVSSVASNARIDYKTASAYINGFVESFLFYKTLRFDIVGNRLLNSTEKYYAVDVGLRQAALGNAAGDDLSRPLENVVYLELLRRGYNVTIGCYRDKEVDFTASLGKRLEFYQVTLTVMDDPTFNREKRPLEAMRNSFPKTILTLDRFPRDPGNGIRHLNVVDWLLGRDDADCSASPIERHERIRNRLE